MTCLKRMLRDLTCSVCPLLIEENAKDVATAKAVRCFNIFNHDSWPEDRLGLLDHGVEELNFLLQHFSTVLDRWVLFVLSHLYWHHHGWNYADTNLVPAILSHVRNRCSKEQAREEFREMKMTIHTSFKDKSYLGLWQVMTTKEPYCSDYRVIVVICSIKHDMIRLILSLWFLFDELVSSLYLALCRISYTWSRSCWSSQYLQRSVKEASHQ